PVMNIDIPPWGIFLIPICLIAEAYAIVKYRSMDINIVFRRGMVYSILLCLLTAVFLISLISFERLFQAFVGYSSMAATAVAALVLAILFQPLKEKVQTLVDRVFFKGQYAYHETLRKTSEAMTSILDLEKLMDHLLSPIVSDMKVRGALLYLMKAEKTGLRLSAHRFHGGGSQVEPCPFIPEDWSLVRRLEWEHLPLIREGVKDQMHPEEAEEIAREMNRLGAELALPVILQNELLGILLLGDKLSGDLFSEEDLQLLGILANQAAVAIENAQLYDEMMSLQEHQENILRNLDSGVITVDREGRITTFNRAAERMTQSKGSEMLGKDCRVLDEALSGLLLNTLFQGKGRSGVEIVLQGENGKVLPVGVATSLLQSQQGSLLGAIALFSDLTEVKTLEREKWRAEKLAYIGTLAASIAHEIKNPLVSIKTLAQLLPERHGNSEFRTHFSQIALKEVDRIDLLVSQMLDLRENSTPSRMEVLRVEEIVEEILLLLSEQIQKHKIKVERDYRSFPYATRGDRFQLKQAFWNVILNSIQAMKEGGILTVHTELARDGGELPERVVLKISDTGKGISEEHLGRIFDPFFTTKQEGTGLGLSICYKIISEHRGKVQVESELKRGTSLYIFLPAIKP
ncbi:MAG: ATP-binding protein, partial [candidate division NC10 bacterium]|nr:ATP-binding protein [candidate division NC10 bacterium]